MGTMPPVLMDNLSSFVQ